MEVYKKLLEIQTGLKAPKGQENTFGHYNYRSCEDILEAVKPLLKDQNCALVICDGIEHIGERYYICAEASLIDTETGDKVSNKAYAREEESKRGMDGSQITGASSSYARKYALNGLFAIDDAKDADTDGFRKQTNGPTKAEQAADSKKADEINKGFDTEKVEPPKTATPEQVRMIAELCFKTGTQEKIIFQTYKKKSIDALEFDQAEQVIRRLKDKGEAV